MVHSLEFPLLLESDDLTPSEDGWRSIDFLILHLGLLQVWKEVSCYMKTFPKEEQAVEGIVGVGVVASNTVHDHG